MKIVKKILMLIIVCGTLVVLARGWWANYHITRWARLDGDPSVYHKYDYFIRTYVPFDKQANTSDICGEEIVSEVYLQYMGRIHYQYLLFKDTVIHKDYLRLDIRTESECFAKNYRVVEQPRDKVSSSITVKSGLLLDCRQPLEYYEESFNLYVVETDGAGRVISEPLDTILFVVK